MASKFWKAFSDMFDDVFVDTVEQVAPRSPRVGEKTNRACFQLKARDGAVVLAINAYRDTYHLRMQLPGAYQMRRELDIAISAAELQIEEAKRGAK